MKMSNLIDCKVLSPEESLFNDKIEKAKLPLGNGASFAILHDHAPLISKFFEGGIILTAEGKEKKIKSENGGIVKVSNNKVAILIK